MPICSLGLSQIGRMNLGMDASTFKFYTMCGLQEGFEPFAVNMNRDVAMWFSKRLPTFVNVPKDHPQIEVMLHVLANLAGHPGQSIKLLLMPLAQGICLPKPMPWLLTSLLLAGPQSCHCRHLNWGSSVASYRWQPPCRHTLCSSGSKPLGHCVFSRHS